MRIKEKRAAGLPPRGRDFVSIQIAFSHGPRLGGSRNAIYGHPAHGHPEYSRRGAGIASLMNIPFVLRLLWYEEVYYYRIFLYDTYAGSANYVDID